MPPDNERGRPRKSGLHSLASKQTPISVRAITLDEALVIARAYAPPGTRVHVTGNVVVTELTPGVRIKEFRDVRVVAA